MNELANQAIVQVISIKRVCVQQERDTVVSFQKDVHVKTARLIEFTYKYVKIMVNPTYM